MCFIRHKQGDDITFFCACVQRVDAIKLDKGLLWSFSGASTGMVRDIQPASITVNEKEQELYVCDSANSCIQIISTDGVYQGRLVKYNESGLGRPEIIRWNKQIESLLIVHGKDNTKYLSVLKINVD